MGCRLNVDRTFRTTHHSVSNKKLIQDSRLTSNLYTRMNAMIPIIDIILQYLGLRTKRITTPWFTSCRATAKTEQSLSQPTIELNLRIHYFCGIWGISDFSSSDASTLNSAFGSPSRIGTGTWHRKISGFIRFMITPFWCVICASEHVYTWLPV